MAELRDVCRQRELGRLGKSGSESALAQALERFRLPERAPSDLVVGRAGSSFLHDACYAFPELAVWILARGASPTPGESSDCLRGLAAGSGRLGGQHLRERLAGELLALGADVNARHWGETALGYMCSKRGRLGYLRREETEAGLLRVLLGAPGLELAVAHGGETLPAEEAAARQGNLWVAAMIAGERARRTGA